MRRAYLLYDGPDTRVFFHIATWRLLLNRGSADSSNAERLVPRREREMLGGYGEAEDSYQAPRTGLSLAREVVVVVDRVSRGRASGKGKYSTVLYCAYCTVVYIDTLGVYIIARYSTVQLNSSPCVKSGLS